MLALQYLGVQDPLTVGLAWGEFLQEPDSRVQSCLFGFRRLCRHQSRAQSGTCAREQDYGEIRAVLFELRRSYWLDGEGGAGVVLLKHDGGTNLVEVEQVVVR